MEPPRKRPNPDNEDTSTAKKRALTGPNGSPRVNGSMADHDEPNDNDNLEVKRVDLVAFCCYLRRIYSFLGKRLSFEE